MYGFNVIHIFFGTIAGMPHVTDDVPGGYHASFL